MKRLCGGLTVRGGILDKTVGGEWATRNPFGDEVRADGVFRIDAENLIDSDVRVE